MGARLDNVVVATRVFGVKWARAHHSVIDHGEQLVAEFDRIDQTVEVGADEYTFQDVHTR